MSYTIQLISAEEGAKLFEQTEIFLVNTTDTPQVTQAEIRRVLKLKT